MLVAQNIEALMKARKMDAAKLGRAAKLNATGIYDILSGKSQSPKIGTIAKIAQGLDVPISAIFESASDAELRDELSHLMEKLPPDRRELLLRTPQSWIAEVA